MSASRDFASATGTTGRTIVVDSDRHAIEPPEIFASVGAAAAPVVSGRVQRPTHGNYHPIWGRDEFAGFFRDETDPDVYVADMDAEGVDLAVLFPTWLALIGVIPAGVALHACRRYSEWMAGVCAATDGRCRAVAPIHPRGGPDACDELRRAVSQLGCVGAVLPTWVPGLYLGARELDSLYATAVDLDVPVVFHTAVSAEAMPNRFPDALSTHVCAHPMEQTAALCSIVVGGVLERHPALRVGFLESGVSWVPYVVQRLDEHFERLSGEVPHLRRRPSEYVLSGQCYFHAEEGDPGLPYAVARLGDESLMYASDYPHWDSNFPEGVGLLRQRADLTDATKARILGLNAARFYGPRLAATT